MVRPGLPILAGRPDSPSENPGAAGRATLMPLLFWGAAGVVSAALLSAMMLIAMKQWHARHATPPVLIAPGAGAAGFGAAPVPPPPPFRPAALGAAPACPADMVGLPAARLFIGSPEGLGKPNEHPRHPVELSAFCLDRYEVNTADYKRCEHHGTALGHCTPSSRHFNDRRHRDFSGKTQPIVGVSYDQAAAYCAIQGKRLPSEAEWEYAAAGLSGRRFAWGDAAPTCDRAPFGADPRSDAASCQAACSTSREDRCVAACLEAASCAGPSPPYPAPVGSHPADATPEGIYDLSGNVAEWVADFYADRYPDPETKTPTNTPIPARDPKGPAIGLDRVVRGGSWLNPPGLLRSAARDHLDPTLTDLVGVGFRCAAAAESPPNPRDP